MRIRTIKPEFWTHPVMLRLDHGCRLLAIGLLNLADDEGYFLADADIIRGAIMPKEDSLNVHGWLNELCRIGYCEVRENPELGPIGRVVKFAQNQRVNRPQTSKLKPSFSGPSASFTEHSLNDHGAITDDSLGEGKGMEGKGKEECILPIPPDGGKDAGDLIPPESQKSLNKTPPETADKVIAMYHDLCPSMPRVMKLTDTRRQAIANRFRQYNSKGNGLLAFEDAFKSAEASDFLSGRSGKWNGCGLDWILKQQNMLKILEGHYDNK